MLGTSWKNGIPIEVIPMAYYFIKQKIEKELKGQAILRQAQAKAVSSRFSETLTFHFKNKRNITLFTFNFVLGSCNN